MSSIPPSTWHDQFDPSLKEEDTVGVSTSGARWVLIGALASPCRNGVLNGAAIDRVETVGHI